MNTPLTVVMGPNEPQAPVGVQLQVTPASDESFTTAAPMVAVPVTAMVAGGAGCRETEITAGVLIWGVAPVPPPQPASVSRHPSKTTQIPGKNFPVQRGGNVSLLSKRFRDVPIKLNTGNCGRLRAKQGYPHPIGHGQNA